MEHGQPSAPSSSDVDPPWQIPVKVIVPDGLSSAFLTGFENFGVNAMTLAPPVKEGSESRLVLVSNSLIVHCEDGAPTQWLDVNLLTDSSLQIRGIVALWDGTLVLSTHMCDSGDYLVIDPAGNHRSLDFGFVETEDESLRERYHLAVDRRTGLIYSACHKTLKCLDLTANPPTCTPVEVFVRGTDGQLRPHSFECVMGIAIDKYGTIFVCDYDAFEISRLDLINGKYISTAITKHKISGENDYLFYPSAMCFDSDDRLFVMEWDGNRLLVVERPDDPTQQYWNISVVKSGYYHTGPSIEIDSQGRIYTSDEGNVVIIEPEIHRRPGMNAVRLGLASLSVPLPQLGKDLLNSFGSIGPDIDINPLILRARFGLDGKALLKSALAELGAAHLDRAFLDALTWWVYADKLPAVLYDECPLEQTRRICEDLAVFYGALGSQFDELCWYCQKVALLAGKMMGHAKQPTHRLESDLSKNAPPKTLPSAMRSLLDSPDDLCDFTIVAVKSIESGEPVEIKCHSSILKARWPFFSSLLRSGLDEARHSRWTVHPWSGDQIGLDADPLHNLVVYFYTGEFDHIQNAKSALQILAMREYFGFEWANDNSHADMLEHCQRLLDSSKQSLSASQALLLQQFTASEDAAPPV